MDDVVILSAVRTPIGAFQGGLAGLPAHALGARAIAAAIERAGVTPQDIQQVNMGCVLTAGQGQAPARQAAAINGCTSIALTKLDVLDGLLPEVKIANAYELDGQRLEYVPSSTFRLARAKPIYETLPCWQQPARGARTWEQLPNEARAYADRVQTLVGVPVTLAGTGPTRLALAQRSA